MALMKRWQRRTFLSVALSASWLCASVTPASADNVRIALVVKNLGNGFFEAARNGGLEAAKELGGVDVIYTGPTTPTAEGQIEIISSLIAQRVDAIVISANDPDALVPICKRAMSRGIAVLSFDSGVAKAGRLFQINPSSPALIGEKQIEMVSQTLGGKGEIAILSATAQAQNQNTWIRVMKDVLARPEYSGLSLVDVVYGDDQSDKSYREAIGLLRKHPALKAIIAPTTVGVGLRQGDHRSAAGGQGLRHRPRPAVGDGRARPLRRGRPLRDLESDRPRLHGGVCRPPGRGQAGHG